MVCPQKKVTAVRRSTAQNPLLSPHGRIDSPEAATPERLLKHCPAPAAALPAAHADTRFTDCPTRTQ